MKTNRRGFFGVFAGLLSAIRIRAASQKQNLPTIDLSDYQIGEVEFVDPSSTVRFWRWEYKRMKPVEYELYTDCLDKMDRIP